MIYLGQDNEVVTKAQQSPTKDVCLDGPQSLEAGKKEQHLLERLASRETLDVLESTITCCTLHNLPHQLWRWANAIANTLINAKRCSWGAHLFG